jgi:8-oxo-dGTP pyrophosphatase MutT (NUDIX family)
MNQNLYNLDHLPVTEHELATPTSGKRNRCYGGILRYSGNDGSNSNGSSNSNSSQSSQFLLVKGRQTGIWSFPKGHSIKGETPLECAKREIREETGIHLNQEPVRAQRLKGGIYFVFDLQHTILSVLEDNFEIEENRWVTREEMEYLIVNSGVKDFLCRKVLA